MNLYIEILETFDREAKWSHPVKFILIFKFSGRQTSHLDGPPMILQSQFERCQLRNDNTLWGKTNPLKVLKTF